MDEINLDENGMPSVPVDQTPQAVEPSQPIVNSVSSGTVTGGSADSTPPSKDPTVGGQGGRAAISGDAAVNPAIINNS